MASRLIADIIIDEHMQLDKVIDTYFDNTNYPNPLTFSNIDSEYYDIENMRNIQNYSRNCNFSCKRINIRSLPNKFDKFKVLLTK